MANKDEVFNKILDLTNLMIVDYNLTFEETDEKYDGTKLALMLTGTTGDARVYSGVKASLGKEIDIKNSKISLYVKLDTNVYKNRVSIQYSKDDGAK